MTDKPGGSGLGLAIVKWVAEVHGGIVTVKSNLEPGKNGSCFEVRLPVNKQT
jgi:signal transduction histidine kinase